MTPSPPGRTFTRVSKKAPKVSEPKALYAAKKTAKKTAAANKPTGETEFQRIAGKLLKERKELLHKLAQ